LTLDKLRTLKLVWTYELPKRKVMMKKGDDTRIEVEEKIREVDSNTLLCFKLMAMHEMARAMH